MNTKKIVSHGIFAVIFALAFIACDNGSGGTAPTITTASLPGGKAGTAYNQTLTANGTAPITWSRESGALPGGLTLNATGAITGTPTAAGTFNFTVKATNTAGSGTKALSIVIAADGSGGGTPGLAYELINNNTAYSVSKGTVTSGSVVIPATYNGLPVTQIGGSAFANCTGLTSVTFEGTIAAGRFSSDAFYNLGDLREKYLAAGGGVGTYTSTNGGTIWTKQP